MAHEQFDWVEYAEAVAADIFGEPNAETSQPPDDVRFCNHGSVSVNYTTGQWYDFENEHGGGIKELIRVYKEIDNRDAAIAYAEESQQNFENGQGPTLSAVRLTRAQRRLMQKLADKGAETDLPETTARAIWEAAATPYMREIEAQLRKAAGARA